MKTITIDGVEYNLLPKVKFKAGNWIVCWNRTYQILDNKSTYIVREINGLETRYEHSTVDENGRLWTIEDAKDGDVLAYQDEIFLIELVGNNSVLYHCCFDGELVVHSFYAFINVDLIHVQPATKEQRDLLFAKMREAGYTWDEKKKELKKIQPHYDISNFYAGMPVLVRDGDCHEWRYVTFSHYRKDGTRLCAGGQYWFQCIPFNEETKHLLGTTDKPSEEYINW